MEVDMKPVFMLLLLLLVAEATPPLGRCPPGCRCDPDPRTVWCSRVEVLPRFDVSVEEVWLVGTKLLSIPQKAFADLLNVSHIYISDDDALTHVERHSFHNLSRLTHVQLSAIKRLSFIDPEAFMELPNLKYLGIINTGLASFPSLTHLHSQQDDFILDIMENTFIHLIPANAFSGISRHSLTVMLNNNGVKEIQRGAFNGSRLEEVYLHGNVDLEKIDELAFDGVIRGPTHLDVSGSRVKSLPTLGMESLEKLRATNVWSLRVLPPPRAFPHLKSAQLTFPSHCCALTTLKSWRGPSEAVICNLSRAALKAHPEAEAEAEAEAAAPLSQTSRGRRLVRLAPPTDGASARGSGCPRSAGDAVFYVELPTERPGEEFDFAACGGGDVASERQEPSCSPLPDAFNPCEDVMSGGLLRVLVWVVSLLAVSANLLVLLILLASRRKLTVTRFLMGHLVFADLCMGTYLLLIASVDMHTRSRYHHYAVAWQTGPGCSLAGALSVFASEMSVFTLTSISLQRWHAIFYAMRPDRKLRLRHAAALMLLGWLLCVLLALLPVLGVSTYQKVSVCLPMDTESRWAWAYVVSLLMIKVVAGVVVCLCYLHIYCMVHNPRHQSSKYDTSMAKRMAVLIFTNFLCLAPICFYGLSAALHQPLITITGSKVLLVLFYPLNSCAHPFFYAILTKAFHRDILMLLSRMGLCQRQAHLYRSQMATINTPLCAHAKSDTRSGLRILKLSNT